MTLMIVNPTIMNLFFCRAKGCDYSYQRDPGYSPSASFSFSNPNSEGLLTEFYTNRLIRSHDPSTSMSHTCGFIKCNRHRWPQTFSTNILIADVFPWNKEILKSQFANLSHIFKSSDRSPTIQPGISQFPREAYRMSQNLPNDTWL